MNWYLNRRASGSASEEDQQELRQSLDSETKRHGVNEYRTANARQILAMHLETMGRHSEALPLRATQYEILLDHKGPEHQESLLAELWLVTNLAGFRQDLDARIPRGWTWPLPPYEHSQVVPDASGRHMRRSKEFSRDSEGQVSEGLKLKITS